MDRAIVTGMNGTLAPVLAEALVRRGIEVVPWDRQRVSPENDAAVIDFIDTIRPRWIYHLAMGAERWAGQLAAHSAERGIGLLFTSTAMVFDHEPTGPHRVDDPRTARDDYGQYKIRCEDAIAQASDRAVIARLGWQIGTGRGGNNMIEALHRMVETDGHIAASQRWIPATSFMTDTCEALCRMADGEPGTYHIDSNASSALTFHDVVVRLAARLGAGWPIEPNDDYVHDQRLVDPRVDMPALATRL